GTFGSDYRFNQFSADFRGYLPLGEDSVLAAQLLGTGLDGDPPFVNLKCDPDRAIELRGQYESV
ncbi:MAG: MmcQ/YjbR family DNA-binding protein, partial [Bacteroidales bacterium]|nr:MmcQ/YjbR family DNA-binding protein [Bacteroidales bacterium]